MRVIDKRFNQETIAVISSLAGNTFNKYKSDPFIFTSSVYGIIGVYIGDEVYRISNFIEPTDFYGKDEDVAIFKFELAQDEDIHSYMDDGELIETIVDAQIRKIIVVNEHQKLFHNDIQTYDVSLTRGIIFEMEDERQIAFEKDIWFSEEINIHKGQDLISKFAPVETFIENWEEVDDYRAECDREEIVIPSGEK